MPAKKVLLTAINAKYIHSNLAVYSLKANTGSYESFVELCEYTINHRKEEILRGIFEKRPDVIGFSCYLWNIEYVLAIAEDVKKILPDSTILSGGPEVSYHPEEVLEAYPFIDIVMVGEGEKTFREYMTWLIDGKGSLAQIDGLVYRKGNQILRTSPRQGMDMEELVFPYRSIEGMENRILYYESSRGCPFSCSYCLSSIEKTVRMKSMEKTIKELAFFLEHKVPQVKFVDRTFNCNHEHAYGVWKYIGEHDNGVTNFHFEIAGDLLREEDFSLFETFRPGLVQFEIGVQSTNPETLRAIRRTMDLSKLYNNIKRVHAGHNIHEHLDLIAGLPFEDFESFRKSFNDVYDMKPDQLQLGFLKVLDGSYMKETGNEYGVVYSSQPPYEVFSTKWLRYEEILRLKQVEEMVEVYYNSFQFAATMAYLLRFFETAFDLYLAVGEYYEKHHLFDRKHSRLSRYEILWEFAGRQKLDSREREVLRETMTYDLFSRDYVKNPPSFVRARTEKEKLKIRAFFDRQCENPTILKDYEGFVTKQLYHLLYVDCFTVDIKTLLETGQIDSKSPFYLMFDYKKRNPLNHSASVIHLKELEE
ncbi:MAG: B12-binding domain-containing radical SAM protein [Lachnospiraceae bacterium]|nr:B12-binding domain-containing radical SAM protein [Lachnospiraceae bacterium]